MRFSDEEIQIMDGQIAASQEEGEEPQITNGEDNE